MKPQTQRVERVEPKGIRARGGLFVPSGKFVGLEGTDVVFGIAPGTQGCGRIFVPSRRLALKSDGRCTHIRYTSLYWAMRGQMHALLQGGAHAEHAGEIGDLEQYAEAIIAYALYLLKHVGARSPEEERELREMIAEIRGELQHAEAPSKILAHTRVIRGSTLYDVRGRRNPPAAARALGASVQHLQKRMQDIRAIAPVLNRRVLVLWELLYAYHRFFSSLFAALNRDDWTDDNEHRRLFALLRNAQKEPKSFRAIRGLLRAFENLMPSLAFMPNPFRGHAMRTKALISAARERANERVTLENTGNLYRGLVALRRALIPWHVQQQLEFGVLTPLMFVRPEEHRAYQQGISSKESTLSRVYACVQSVYEEVRNLPNLAMHPRLRTEILKELEYASRAATIGAWLTVKERVKKASMACSDVPSR